jgi:hypothetical protein
MSSSLPGCDALNDDAFQAAFHAGHVSKDVFGHREHVRLAFICLSRHPDLAEAALQFRQAFRRFVVAQGMAHVYNETLTWAYLVLVNQRMHEKPAKDSFDFLRQNPDLCDHRRGLISQYYDLAQVTRSPLAKELFVLPDAKLRST